MERTGGDRKETRRSRSSSAATRFVRRTLLLCLAVTLALPPREAEAERFAAQFAVELRTGADEEVVSVARIEDQGDSGD